MAHESQRQGPAAGYERGEEEGMMLTHDYLFAVLFMVGVWYILHAGRGHSLWH
jgi:hypothetical protein